MKSNKLSFYSKKLMEFKPSNKKRFTKNKISPLKILRVISQRPYFTGSGINLVNLINQSNLAGFKQFVIFGQPVGELNPLKDILRVNDVLWTSFKNEIFQVKPDVDFSIPGMSDQMPYKSTKFSDFNEEMLESYLAAFGDKIEAVVDYFKPDIIHSHHLWLVTALCRVLNPKIPVIGTCHNTALRQLVLANQLKDFVIKPIQDLDVITVLNEDQKKKVLKNYNIISAKSTFDKTRVIGTSLNTDFFYPPSQNRLGQEPYKLIYVGKLSYAKGVPELISAFTHLCKNPEFIAELSLVGSGDGEEKESIIEMSSDVKEKIHFLGQIEQSELADHFRGSDLFILPSYYEGYPRVVLEALACGTKAIMTDLPGIKENISKTCGISDNLSFIPMPLMKSIDQPKEEAIPSFIEDLKREILSHISRIKDTIHDHMYAEKIRKDFGWKGFFQKYVEIYNSLIKD